MTAGKPPTDEEIAKYDAAMEEVLDQIIHLLHCQRGMSRETMVVTLLVGAARLSLGFRDVCERYRSVSGIVIAGLIERGELGRPN